MTGDQTAGIVTGIMCLTLAVSSLAARRLPMGKTLKMALAWVAIFAGAYVLVLFRGTGAEIWSRARTDLGIQPELSGGVVRINAREDGHYYITGRINGRPAEFLIDSGATTTAISTAVASASGVTDDGMPPIPISTANGMTMSRTARIERLEIGAIVQTDARTTIGDSLGDTNLLGMSFLSQLKSWRVEGNTLILQL
ncbi:TIGR02281 family clan AA aspartic protease [Sphingomonas antarctica]|uniref:retropepsin-like aspartic protease family protein n=1 Tax=Sphingomonas antarctica TaxID=2040274 RepID=UPI0039ED6ECA